ncbi:MAG: diaminopimelate decarboxylase [Promethearchaeota archaeon]
MELKEWLKRKNLEYKDNILYFAGMNTLELVKKYGTPLYVISEDVIRERYRELKKVLNSEHENNDIHFAVKANSSLTVLKILQSEGANFDCTSRGEIFICFTAGISPEQIIYTGNMFTNEDFDFAVKKKIMINLDCISQLKRLIKVYERFNTPASEYKTISFRINPKIGAGHHVHTITAGKHVKFGILEEQVVEAYLKAKNAGFSKFGIHMHMGSGIINYKDYEQPVAKFLSIIRNLWEKLGISFEFVDFGGGLGIPYRPEETPLDLEGYKNVVLKPFKEFIQSTNMKNVNFKIEPGRYLSAESGLLLTQINTIKNNGYKLFAGVDAGFNTLIRPTMYGSYHHIIPCKLSKEKNIFEYDIAGPICESGDILGRERKLPELSENEYLAIMDAGAYGFVMSSQYNSRPRPAEILITQKKDILIRKSETYDDLIKNQLIPDHLK